MTKIRCAICGSHDTRLYFEVRNSPLLQNVLCDDESSARLVRTTNAPFWACVNCLFLFNPEFVASDYSTEYNNDQSLSPRYREHIEEVVSFVTAGSREDIRILEIGCGNGLVLKTLQEHGHTDLEGYDPAHAGHLPYVKTSLWTPSDRKYDTIILRHTLEAVDRFEELLGNAASRLDANGQLYLEFTNSRVIIERSATVTLYHEYPHYFSESALAILFARLGMYVHETRHFFGGELTGMLARRQQLRPPRSASFERLRPFQNVCIWGVSGRSVHFLTNYAEHLASIKFGVDLDPRKQGKFVPHSGQKIISPEECFVRRPDAVIILNEHYVTEVANLFPYPVTILTAKDFYVEG